MKWPIVSCFAISEAPQVLLLWPQQQLKSGAMKWIPGFHRFQRGYAYMEMLDISSGADFEQSSRLSTTLDDEASRPG